MRVGIAGYGVVGKKRYSSIIKNTSFKVTDISEVNPTARDEIPDGVNVFNNYQDLILKADLDIIFISLPNKYASDAVSLSLKKGLNVFCEKPPARTLEELLDVQKIYKKNPHVKLMYGFNHRFHLSVEEAKTIIDSKNYGKVINLKGVYGKSQMIDFNQTDWRTKREESGGGILLDQGIHMLDLMRYFCGDFAEIKSFVSNYYWKHKVEDNAYIIMRSNKKIVAMLHSTATQWQHQFRIEITLEKALIYLTGILSGSMTYGEEKIEIQPKLSKNKKATKRSFNKDLSWEREISEYIDCIKFNKKIYNGTIFESIKVMKMIDTIYKSDNEWKEKYLG